MVGVWERRGPQAMNLCGSMCSGGIHTIGPVVAPVMSLMAIMHDLMACSGSMLMVDMCPP